MADETGVEWEAKVAAAQWAIQLVAAHPELIDLVPPSKRHFYTVADDEDE